MILKAVQDWEAVDGKVLLLIANSAKPKDDTGGGRQS